MFTPRLLLHSRLPLLIIGCVAALCLPLRGAEDDAPPAEATIKRGAVFVAPASDEGENAVKQLAVAPGFTASLWAAEPRLANPVALSFDEQGRCYVVETFRRRGSVLDIRKLPKWLDDDLACRTVADRIAMVQKHLPKDWPNLIGVPDRVRVITDRDGDGKADHDSVFADGFDKLENGTAAGVLAWGGNVYFADIPDIWRLRDTDGDGRADDRTVLSTGYGVRYGFSGHDLHGLRMGPDGRIYFSVADRGAHVTDPKSGKVLASAPDTGSVFRCNPDGSDFELVHTGLRNPQELAFDQYGNLFTCDNNSDGGDATRWVYVVEGGDSGWHVGWQWHDFPTSRGPWNSEKLWDVNPPVPAFHRLPPIATPKISGPSGLTYTPGTGMPPELADRFLLVDFRGGAAGGSGVYTLKNQPKGAGFELVETKPFVTNVLPSDVEFGNDGAVYITDWVTGWEPHGKGRIYRFAHAEAAKNPLVAETRKLIAEDFSKRESDDVLALLGHADMRVRMRAQFEMVRRQDVARLRVLAESRSPELARIHALWALGQLARSKPDVLDGLQGLLSGPAEEEVRVQVAKVLGDARYAPAAEQLVKALSDPSARMRYFSAIALGKIGHLAAARHVIEMLRANADQDAYLRHAGVMSLFWINDAGALAAAARDAAPAVRMTALLVYRRQRSPEVSQFLADADPNLVLEAARAINDETIDAAMPALASLLEKPGLIEPVMIRALNANYRIGTPQGASALAALAAKTGASALLRIEALRMLGDWEEPSGRDRVTGLWRPVQPRDAAIAKAALDKVLDELLRSAPDEVRVAALKAATTTGITATPLLALVKDSGNPPGLRAAALGVMAERKDPKLAEAARVAVEEQDPIVRLAGIRVQSKLPDGLMTLGPILESGTPREQQAALQALASISSKDGKVTAELDKLLLAAFARLEKGTLPPEASLDLLEAAAARKSGKVAERLKAWNTAQQKLAETDPLAPHRAALAGGDAARGQYIFRERADAQCLRCHAVAGQGGNAGPDLAGLSKRGNREHVLESILMPGKKIAVGFETVTIRTKDEEVHSGVLKSETEQEVTLEIPEKGIVKILKSQIDARRGGMSAMPDDIAKTLTPQDLRDLVEYLSGL